MVAAHRYIAPFDLTRIPWQLKAMRDTSLVNLYTGSAGGGKSRLALEKIHALLLKYPGATGVMVRKTRESVINSLVLPFEYQVVGRTKACKHVISKSRFEYSNGSILAYGGMKNREQREQIRSIGLEGGLDFVLMEEATAFVEDDYNELLARMRGRAAPFVQLILATNPDAPAHWIHQRLMLGKQAKVFMSEALDNPYNPPAYIEILKQLTGLLYKRLVLGQWVLAEGAVYDSWNPDIHVIDALPDNPELVFKRFVGGQDWGFTNPGVFQVWGVDGDNRMTLVHEIYQTRKLIGWWKDKVKALCKQYGIYAVVCDPAEPANIEEYTQAGIPAQAADNTIMLGIQRVQQRLAVADDGRPRMQVYRGALEEIDYELQFKKLPTCLIDEMPAYVWETGTDGKPHKEKPLDLHNHAEDVARYVTAFVDANAGRIGISRL